MSSDEPTVPPQQRVRCDKPTLAAGTRQHPGNGGEQGPVALCEPALELHERVGVHVRYVERSGLVLAPQLAEIHPAKRSADAALIALLGSHRSSNPAPREAP